MSLLEEVKYDFGYMFSYSERPGTPAEKKLADDIPEETKKNGTANRAIVSIIKYK